MSDAFFVLFFIGFGAINAKTIIDAMREIAEQPVVFNVNMDTFEIVVDYQNGHYNFVGMSGNEYPEPTEIGDGAHSLTMPTDVLLGGITRSIFATADDELRPVMNGVYFDICTEYVTFVASDGLLQNEREGQRLSLLHGTIGTAGIQ